MPYRKNAPRRRNTRKSGYQMYKQIAPYLPKVEIKQNLVQNTANPTSGTTYILINGLFQGGDKKERIGRTIQMSSIQWAQRFTSNTTVMNSVRCAIVLDRQPNGAIFNSSDVFGTSFTTTALRDIDHQSRFKVLKDYTVNLVPDQAPRVVRKFYLKIPKYLQEVSYDVSNTGGIADITTNSLYLIMCGETVNTPTVVTDMKINYYDA